MAARCLGVRRKNWWCTGFLGQWKCLRRFQNKDYMSLFISHNAENIQLKTEPKVGSGCLWYVDECLSVVIDISHSDVGYWWWGSFECVGGDICGHSVLSTQLSVNLKTLSNNLKKNLFQNRVFRAKIFHTTMRQMKITMEMSHREEKILTHFRIV